MEMMTIAILFALTAALVLLVTAASVYLVCSASDAGLTCSDLDRIGILDRAYIALASTASWNDTD